MNTKQYKRVLNIINTTTTEQQLCFLQAIADKIIINVPTKKGTNCCTIEDPHFNINLNGIYIDINLQPDVKDYINCDCQICEGEGFIFSNNRDNKDEAQKWSECNIFKPDAEAQ